MTEAAPRKSDLGVRVLSAVMMVAVAGAALWLGGIWWQLFVAAVAIVCFGEFARLIWLATPRLLVRLAGTLVALLYVGEAANILAAKRHSMTHDQFGYLGLISVLAIVGFVIVTDIGAYFAGRTIGGPKIAPKISPSKTWAGLAGGMIAAGLWGLFALYLPNAIIGHGESVTYPLHRYLLSAFLSGALLASVAQAGDFFQSWLKRKAGVKDSSNIIPGHGGVFDRADGLIPVILLCGFVGDWMIFGDWLLL